MPEHRQEFRATWRGSAVWVALLVALMAVGFAAGALAAPRGAWLLGALAFFFGLMAWLLLQPLLSAHPILRVGPEGIGGYLLKGHTIPWSDVADVAHLVMQGQHQIQIQLREGAASQAATAGLLRRGLKRVIALAPLRRADREPAAQAALLAFQRHATGQAQVALTQRLDEMQAHHAFEERLRTLTPTPWALYAVIAVNVAVWLLNLWDGMSPMKPSSVELFAWGANSATAVVRDGEHWRLLTATALHGGVLHLGLNMFALWDAGRRVCRWFGNGQFLLIYLGAGLAGSALSLHFSSQQAVSVGASGAVFGVLGALLVGVYQHRGSVPKAMATQLLTSQGVFVLIMLGQGFARPGIDNAAHVGGLVMGALLAWLLVELIDERASPGQRRRRQVMAVGATVLLVGALVGLARPGVDHRQLFDAQARLTDMLPRLKAAEAALQQDAKGHKEKRLSEAQFVDAMAERHIPAYRAIDAELAELAGSMPPTPVMADIRELHGLVLEVMTLEVGQHRGTLDGPQTAARLKQLSQQMVSVGARQRARNAQPARP